MGRDLIVETAYDMGIRSELPITRPLPLGVAEVTPLDMASAYASLGNGGYRTSGYAIMEMRTLDGELVYDRSVDGPAAPRILSAEAVTGMNRMLHQVIEAGTARRAQLPGISASGKTGTTQAYRDAWFIGYTGRYTASVWYGNDDFTSTANLTGGRLPAMTWQSIMELAHRDSQPPLLPGVDEAVRDDVELVTARDASEDGPALASDLSEGLMVTCKAWPIVSIQKTPVSFGLPLPLTHWAPRTRQSPRTTFRLSRRIRPYGAFVMALVDGANRRCCRHRQRHLRHANPTPDRYVAHRPMGSGTCRW